MGSERAGGGGGRTQRSGGSRAAFRTVLPPERGVRARDLWILQLQRARRAAAEPRRDGFVADVPLGRMDREMARASRTEMEARA